jgi:cardiolipin synthase
VFSGSHHALRALAEQALARAAGAPLVPGNAVRLLRDAGEHFPAWLAAIEAARERIAVEAYLFADDPLGRRFADALAARARAGVEVRVLRDWYGALGEAGRGFWRRLQAAGVEVRTFNPPRLDSPLGWIGRDHRKLLVVDGEVGFVTGVCLAGRWEGDPAKGVEPWRDTGVEIRGPAVADLWRAFAAAWATAGPPLAAAALPARETIPARGAVALRVIATEPSTSGIFRLDQLVAAMARRTLWITDAYFVGTAAYVQALRSAAADGVDVRILVPGESDLVLVKRLSVAGYRPLLEAGVRIFEWNGSMLHAKSAVADGRWARVGSSNLNLSSWLANWELDVAVEDEIFAAELEDAFLSDLEHATEVVLGARRPWRRRREPGAPRVPRPRPREGSAVSAAGALRLGRAVGAALGGSRVLGPAESRLLVVAALLLVGVAAVLIVFPRVLATPAAVFLAWLAVGLGVRARRLRKAGAPEGLPARTSTPRPATDEERPPATGSR